MPINALIDSGASTIFIEPALAGRLPSGIRKLPNSVDLFLFDGSPAKAGSITDYIETDILFEDGTQHHISALVTNLHKSASIILGLSWLRQYNPIIDWSTLSLKFRSSFLSTQDRRLPRPTPSLIKKPPAEPVDPAAIEMQVLRDLFPWGDLIPPKPIDSSVRPGSQPADGDPAPLVGPIEPLTSLPTDPLPIAPLPVDSLPSAPSKNVQNPLSTAQKPPNPVSPLPNRQDPSDIVPPQRKIFPPLPIAPPTTNAPQISEEPLKTIVRSKGAPSANAWKFPHLQKSIPHATSATSSRKTPSTPPTPEIRLIGAAPFALLVRNDLVACYGTLNIKPATPMPQPPPKENPDAKQKEASVLDEHLPKEYHDFADVFSEQEAKTMPPH